METEKEYSSRLIMRIVLIYMAFSVIWISLGDFLLFQSISQGLSFTISVTKGYVFVLLSSLLIFLLLRYTFSQLHLVEDKLEGSQQKLEDVDTKLEFLMNQIPVVFWEMDQYGVIKKIFGKNLERLSLAGHEIEGHSIFDLYNDYPEVIKKAREVLNGTPVQWKFSTAGRHYENYYQPLIDDGEVVGALGLGIDITDTTTMKNELKSTQQSLQAMHRLDLLGTVLGKVTHDMNNHFTLIKGYMELIEESNSPEAILSYLSKLHRSINKGQNLLENLLSYSKMSRKEKMLPLKEVFEDLQPILEYLSTEMVIMEYHFDKRLSDHVVPKVKFDAIITNLLSNAIDALSEGRGYVTLNIIADESDRSGDYILIEVSDSGTGISSDILPHIFDPLFTTKPEDMGTGLGLSIVTDMVKSLDGFIDVDTGSAGTSIRVYLPYSNSSVKQDTTSDRFDYKVPSEQFSVMVLDDSSEILDFIKAVILPYASKTYFHSDPIEALQILDALDEKIDLFIVDAVIPEFDGIAFAKRVRSKYPEIPIILMSGYKAMDVISSKLDNSLYLSKPFIPAKLLHFITTCLE